MNRACCFLILILGLITASCTKNQFKLDISLPTDVNANYRLIYYASSSKEGFIVESVAAVNAGKCRLIDPVRNPAIVFLFSQNSGTPQLFFWVEKGDDIKISGSSDDPMEWSVKGNRISEQLSDWRLENIRILRKGEVKEINGIVAKTIKERPDERLSALLLLLYYDRRTDEPGFLKLWNLLGKKSKRDEMAAIVGRTDLFEDPLTPQNVGKIVLVPLPEPMDSIHKRDTLNPAAAELSLLYFYRDGSENVDEAVDSMKSWRKKFDSSKLAIARVCLDPDSLLWANRERNDSLSEIKSYWLPGGINNQMLDKIGVRRSDFFVVINRKGKQLYRGSKPSEVSKTLRKKV